LQQPADPLADRQWAPAAGRELRHRLVRTPVAQVVAPIGFGDQIERPIRDLHRGQRHEPIKIGQVRHHEPRLAGAGQQRRQGGGRHERGMHGQEGVRAIRQAVAEPAELLGRVAGEGGDAELDQAFEL
jgi:hypothetical protein